MIDEQQGKGQSAELTAGTGFTFEDTVVAVYLSALLEENKVWVEVRSANKSNCCS